MASFSVRGDYKVKSEITSVLQDSSLKSITTTNGGLPTAQYQGEYLYYDGTEWKAGNSNVNIGQYAGQGPLTPAPLGVVAIGTTAGQTKQNSYGIAIGSAACGGQSQGTAAIAIGQSAGNTVQGSESIAIGYQAATSTQSVSAIAIGYQAGNTKQGTYAVAIGYLAGSSTQGTGAIAIGQNAGQTAQGSYSICIGKLAGQNACPANTIVLNASGLALNPTQSGFFVTPITASGSGGEGLAWNSSTGEIYSNSSKTFVIQHPQKEENYLVHACLEGPEVGVYYRGEGTVSESLKQDVFLPEYTKDFYDFTVSVSPILSEDVKFPLLNASRVSGGKFTVYANDECKFSWMCVGKRGDINVEPKKSEVELKGDGPYKYL